MKGGGGGGNWLKHFRGRSEEQDLVKNKFVLARIPMSGTYERRSFSAINVLLFRFVPSIFPVVRRRISTALKLRALPNQAKGFRC